MQENGNGSAERKPKVSPRKAREDHYRALAVQYYLKGANIYDIRKLVSTETGGAKISTVMVNKAIKAAIEEWKSAKADLIDNHKAIELEKINRLELTYWTAWERSLTVQTTKTVREKPIIDKDPEAKEKKSRERSTQKKGSQGNSEFLKGIQWCSEMRCRLLGIEAPMAPAQTTGKTVIVRKVVFKTRETSAQIQSIEISDSNG